jgi:hypothetical protein
VCVEWMLEGGGGIVCVCRVMLEGGGGIVCVCRVDVGERRRNSVRV